MNTLDLTSGTVIGGDFRVVRPLRVGGMGAVYVAEQRSTGAPRALKLMQRELVGDASLRERFEQEARVGATIDSDHVVHVVGAGVDGPTGIPWIAMELLRGVALDEYLVARGARPAGEVRYLFEQLCHALGAAHQRGIVHRDLKPPNVFLCAPRMAGLSYIVKVLDFGIAKVLAEAKTNRTAAVGTPMYMAPEQYEAGHVSPATDVWALGLIAFELLTGKSYWKAASGGDATPASIMYETCLGELVPASTRAQELGSRIALPVGFDEWFAVCVSRKAEARFVDARAALGGLASVLGPPVPPHEPLPEREAPAVLPSGTPIAPATSARVSAEIPPTLGVDTPAVRPMETEVARPLPPTRAVGRDRRPLFAGAAVGLVLVGALGVFALRPSSKSEPQTAPSVAAAAPSPSARAPKALAHFSTGTTALVDGRLMHARVPNGVRTETYLMVEVRGADAAPKTPTPVHLSLVIDRSGSMKGKRLESAIAGAKQAIARLRDGDRVSVIAFDDKATTIVPTVKLDSTTRAEALAKVDQITLGGNTCISCGIDLARTSLGEGTDLARRILLLSDGEATAGVKDVPGFEKLARAAQASDVSITTIGVGDDYDPKTLTALARESNGQHAYAKDEAAMPAIFEEHAKKFASVVALAGEATIKLAPGVELITVFDRSHRVEGNVVHVPLGQLVRAERKTILLKVAVTGGAIDESIKIADVSYGFRDLLEGGDGKVSGSLSAFVGDGPNETDAIVEARVARSDTAAALLKATQLFEQGKTKEADAALGTQIAALDALKSRWTNAGAEQLADVSKQREALEAARKSYKQAVTIAAATPMPMPTTKPGNPYGGGGAAAPPPMAAPAAAKPAKMQSKKSAEVAADMAY